MRHSPALAAAAVLSVGLSACSGSSDSGDSSDADSSASSRSSASASETTGSETPETPLTPEADGEIVTDLAAPWDIAFLPDGDAVVPERDSGVVHLVSADGGINQAGTFDEASGEDEAGLLGVAVSPDFTEDRTLFFYLTTADDNRVVRSELSEDGTLGDSEPVITAIPHSNRHDGGRMLFGPDGSLYVATGDAGQPSLAQDPDSLAGKILRITTGGDPASDNPDPASPVFSLGHRNVQGLAFDDDGRLWASEFGDATFDELNLIEAGGNYGWPEVEGTGGTAAGFIDPLVTWDPDEASPSGMAYAEGSLWVAALNGERLWRVDIDDAEGDDAPSVGDPVAFFEGTYGRLRHVAAAPDGTLWLLTNNTDGRVTPRGGDDRIVPLALG